MIQNRNRKTTKQKKPRRPGASRRNGRAEPAQFLTIDLEVKSRRSLALLAAALESGYHPIELNGQPNRRWLIMSASGDTSTAESTARGLVKQLSRLPAAARQCWNQSATRTFDIGIQGGDGPRSFKEVRLTPKTLSRIASLGARIQVTVYPPQPAK